MNNFLKDSDDILKLLHQSSPDCTFNTINKSVDLLKEYFSIEEYSQRFLVLQSIKKKVEVSILLLLLFIIWISFENENSTGTFLRGLFNTAKKKVSKNQIEEIIDFFVSESEIVDKNFKIKHIDDKKIRLVFIFEIIFINPYFSDGINLLLFQRKDPESHPFNEFYNFHLKNSIFFHNLLFKAYSSSNSKILEKFVFFVVLYEFRIIDQLSDLKHFWIFLDILVQKLILSVKLENLRRFTLFEGLNKESKNIIELICEYLLQKIGEYYSSQNKNSTFYEEKIREIVYGVGEKINEDCYFQLQFIELSE